MSCSLLRSSHISLAYFSPSFEEPTKTCRFIKCTSFCRAIIGEPSRVHRPIALLERSDGRHDIPLSIVTTKAESFHRIADSIRLGRAAVHSRADAREGQWWARGDSNARPLPCQGSALTN